MPRRFHNVYVVAYPIGVDDQYFSIDEYERAVGVNTVAQFLDKRAQPIIGGGENGREAQLLVVIRAVSVAVYPHSGQFVLKFNHLAPRRNGIIDSIAHLFSKNKGITKNNLLFCVKPTDFCYKQNKAIDKYA